MESLNFQDAIFLRLESPERPFHIAGLAFFTLPRNAAPDYLRELVKTLGQLPDVFPAFGKKLNPLDANKALGWVEAQDYDPEHHVFHYAVPAPGRTEDLIQLVSRTHERVLDRSRPLWELHVVEGLAGNRFALYWKFHHAIVDGVGALQMVNTLFSESAKIRLDLSSGERQARFFRRAGLIKRFSKMTGNLLEQSRAIPELSSMLGTMGRRGWFRGDDTPPLPFTAPYSLFNHEVSNHRQISTVELPLKKLREIAAAFDASLNDVIVAICGGAIRDYLLEQDALPAKSLFAGIPVSVKAKDDPVGNHLSTIICPFGTDLEDPAARLKRISMVTRQSKADLANLTRAASQDYLNLVLIPSLLLTLAGASTSIPPPFNVIVSNVPGARERLYLEGSRLDAMYPLSLVTDAQALNITAISYMNKMCLGIVACPSLLPAIDTLGDRVKVAYRELGRCC